METRPQYIKRLRNEISDVGSQIEQQIVRLDRLSVDIKQGYEVLETPFADKQALAQEIMSNTSMSGDEVWHFAWDSVWDAVKEYKLKATTEIQQNYKELEAALQGEQSVLQERLQPAKMPGDEVWDAIWKSVWNVVWMIIEEFNRQAAMEVKQVAEELKPLLDKQSALQAELHEALMSEDAFYNIIKETTNAILKGTSS